MASRHLTDLACPFPTTADHPRKESGLARLARLTWPLAVLAATAGSAHAQDAAPEHQLKEIVVSASGFEQEIKNAPASITVITREELQSNRVNSIAEALSNVEGVDVTSSVGKTGGLSIQMRGLGSAYTLILIDGRRQNPAGNVVPNGFGDSASTFMPPPSAIERIEVIRGPMATLYGSDAIGGVINIITRKVGKTWGGTVTAETTMHEHSEYGDSRAGSLYLSGPLVDGLLGLQVRARKYKRDASDIQWPGKGSGDFPTLNTGRDPVSGDVNTVGARLSFTPNKNHDLYLDVDQVKQKYDNSRGQIGTISYVDPTKGNRLQIPGYGPQQEFNRDQVTLAHTWRLSNSVLESSVSHNKTETLGRLIPGQLRPDGTVHTAPPGKIPGTPRVLESQSTIFDSKWVTSIGNNMLTLGGQYLDAEMVEGLATSKFKYDQTSVFAENEWRMRKDLALTVGVRHDDHSTFGGATTPRAYLVWNANDYWTVKGGISKGYRTPGLEQLFDGVVGYGRQGDPTRPQWGNPNLKPEKSTSTELGFRFDDLKGFGFNATIFNTDLEDAIGSQTFTDINGNTNASRSINVDSASVRGVELGTIWQFAPAWKLNANYTFTDSEQKTGANKGQPLNNTSRHVFNTKVNWHYSQNLGLWAQHSYNSERFRDKDVAGTNTKALLGNYKAYHMLNLGADYKVNKSWTINMAINNLLDKDFAKYPNVTVDNKASTAPEYVGNFERRRLWVSANYTF
ncbi:Putative exogenous ferric siderophore receptor [Herminiimonas arsenicoxydans]|uniref:Exogenous ferric siderophore receptor n=1 Tax=Herminiimonas arsenicoxydans TaxID=204773 RepID=A4GA75_HERAR|nr:Putative exogenous ferric siderophore receptor [Herminiimonas arsenicoxydans]